MFFRERWTNRLAYLALAAIAAVFAYWVSSHPMDFRVYHYGARGVFDGSRPVYGVHSGLGWPMHYRYPPLFLLLFAPFAMLPIGVAAAIWVLAKIGLLIWLWHAIRNKAIKLAAAAPHAHVISIIFITPYLVEEFRYGNAQFFVLVLTIAGLLASRKRPAAAAAAIGLAISIKVWPVFFLPYMAVRREWRTVALTLAAVAVLTLLPSFYFGVTENFTLLGQWFKQEFATQFGASEIWFPNQSLRGVLMRYLTTVDYSQVPDSNYPAVNLAALAPATIRLVWMVLAAAVYGGFLLLAIATRKRTDWWFDHALAFCLLALLQPFTQKYALAVLLLPAIAAAMLMENRSLRMLMYTATALVLMQPLMPGANAQRLVQVLGFDFAATMLLTCVFAIAAWRRLLDPPLSQ